jgi:hypothetical protein
MINFKYIFKIYNFFGMAKRYPSYPHKHFWGSKDTLRYPLVTPMRMLSVYNVYTLEEHDNTAADRHRS